MSCKLLGSSPYQVYFLVRRPTDRPTRRRMLGPCWFNIMSSLAKKRWRVFSSGCCTTAHARLADISSNHTPSIILYPNFDVSTLYVVHSAIASSLWFGEILSTSYTTSRCCCWYYDISQRKHRVSEWIDSRTKHPKLFKYSRSCERKLWGKRGSPITRECPFVYVVLGREQIGISCGFLLGTYKELNPCRWYSKRETLIRMGKAPSMLFVLLHVAPLWFLLEKLSLHVLQEIATNPSNPRPLNKAHTTHRPCFPPWTSREFNQYKSSSGNWATTTISGFIKSNVAGREV